MRVFTLAIVSLLFVACSTPKPVADTWTTDLIQKEGYLTVPPHLEVKKEYAKPEEFSRCDKIKITNVLKSGNDYYVEFTQNEKRFLMSGVGGQALWSDSAVGHKMFAESTIITPVKKSMTNKLPFRNEHVTYEGVKTPVKKLMCDTPVTWKGMKKEHFHFVMGYPIKHDPHQTRDLATSKTFEYVYTKRKPATYFNGQYNPEFKPNKMDNYSFYYFKQGKLD